MFETWKEIPMWIRIYVTVSYVLSLTLVGLMIAALTKYITS